MYKGCLTGIRCFSRHHISDVQNKDIQTERQIADEIRISSGKSYQQKPYFTRDLKNRISPPAAEIHTYAAGHPKNEIENN